MRLPTPLAVALAAALAAGAAAPAAHATTTPRATPGVPVTEPVVPVPATGAVTVIGKGYGHGRGMSQYGAAEAARRGLTWQQITGFYYPGAAATRLTPTAIRVGLADSIGTGLRVVAAPGLVATDGTTTRALPTGDTVDGVTTPIVRWEVTTPADGTAGTVLTFVTAAGRRAPLAATTGTWTITSTTGSLRVTNAAGTPGATYLGALRGIRSGTDVTPVLITRLDDYVRMVVPNESYGSWPVQALAAQAVAARTYAASYLAAPMTADYDICSSTRCQVVGTTAAETTGSRTAVTLTADVVLTSGGRPIRAEFGSSSGGYTASGGVSYLPAQPDPYDRSTGNPVGTWRAQVPVTGLAAAYPTVGRVTGIQVLTRTGGGELGGRVLTAKVIGTAGTVTTTGDALRRALGTGTVRSTLLAVVPAASRPTPVARPTAGILGLTAGRVTAAARPVLLVPGDVVAATSAGEWDAVPGEDVLSVSAGGELRLQSRTLTGLGAPRAVATGLTGVTAVTTLDDVDGDGQRDLLVRRTDGRLERYTADGTGGLVPASGAVLAPASAGWGSATSITAADVTGDGRDDVVALRPDGTVVAAAGTGRDVLRAPVVLGTLPGVRSLAAHGDLTGDGRDDLVALRADGTVLVVPVTGTGRLGTPVPVRALPGASAVL